VRLRQKGSRARGAETGTEGEVTRATFLHGDPHIAAARDVGLLVRHVHIVEEACVFQTKLTDLHHHFAENIAWTEHELAQDYRALGLRVSFDDDRFDVKFFALLNLILDVDIAGRDVGFAQDADVGLEVAILAVEVLDALGVLIEAGGHEDHAATDASDPLKKRRRVNLVTREADLADPVLASFDDVDRDQQLVGSRVAENDLLLRDIHIEETQLTVEIAKLVQIIFELVVLEAARARQPREHPPFLGLHLALQLARFDTRIADETNVGDFDLRAFLDLENNRAETAHAVALDRVGNGDLIVAGFLVELDQLARIVLHLAFVQREVRPRLGFFFQTVAFDLHITLKLHGKDAIFRGDLDHQVEGVFFARLLLKFDELEEAGAVERAEVAIQHVGVEIATLTDLHIGPNDLLVHVGRADKLDRDRAGLKDRSLLRLLLRRTRLTGSLRPDRSSTRCHQQENCND
jgi:hypothetical protein